MNLYSTPSADHSFSTANFSAHNLTTVLSSTTTCTQESKSPDRSETVAKVLHIINGEHFSGAERVQQLLGQRLADFGVQTEFACLKQGRFAELCGIESHRVSSFPMKNRWDLSVIQKLVTKVRNEGFDILHAHTPRSALIAAAVSARTGLPWCFHVHSPTSRDSTRGLINRLNSWTERFSIRTCSKLLTVSKSLRREMLRLGIARNRLAVVPNGVPALQPIDPHSRITQDSWRLGLIALMRPRKGVEVALRAMKLLRERGAKVELELIGGFESDSYQKEILGLIERQDLQSMVHWSGFTTDIPAALHRIDALVLPSLFGEGMPMVVLEALAAAIPVVATSVEGTPEIIRHGVEGFLAKPGSELSLAENIQELISDRHRWVDYCNASLNRHRGRFTEKAMAHRVARVYIELCERKK